MKQLLIFSLSLSIMVLGITSVSKASPNNNKQAISLFCGDICK